MSVNKYEFRELKKEDIVCFIEKLNLVVDLELKRRGKGLMAVSSRAQFRNNERLQKIEDDVKRLFGEVMKS